MPFVNQVHILGGGIAGLAAGYYAQMRDIPFKVYEANKCVGGNAVTYRHGNFLIDSGAHRYHDKDPDITNDLISLIKDDWQQVEVPSQIYHNGTFVDFPLSPLNIMKNLGVGPCIHAASSFISAKLHFSNYGQDFESFANRTYGHQLAKRFLLDYSEKLWGAPCHQLSASIAGKRMKGLTIGTFIKEALLGKKTKTKHLDGSFYYPKYGIGMISEKLVQAAGSDFIHLNSRITKVHHLNSHITKIEVNNEQTEEVDEVISTLPLPLLIHLLTPSPPDRIKQLASSLRFRHVLLLGIMLNRERITGNGSVYFPDRNMPFTRVYEPKNRSHLMAPPGKTSLISEVPCRNEDAIWNAPEDEICKMIVDKHLSIGWINSIDIIDTVCYRIPFAYPILELDYESKTAEIFHYLKQFKNLRVSGRNGKFMYTHIHDMMRFGKNLIREMSHENILTPSASL